MIDLLLDALAFAHRVLGKADELVEWLLGDDERWLQQEITEIRAQKPSA